MDGDCDAEFEIHLRGAPEMPHIGLEEGYLKLTKYGKFSSRFAK
jgi:hypothetical protein